MLWQAGQASLHQSRLAAYTRQVNANMAYLRGHREVLQPIDLWVLFSPLWNCDGVLERVGGALDGGTALIWITQRHTLTPLHPCCASPPEAFEVGSEHRACLCLTGKWMCAADLVLGRQPCTVFSLGSDADTSFETAILDRWPHCSVRTRRNDS